MQINLKLTKNFIHCQNAEKENMRTLVLQGSTRSAKSYSALQYMLLQGTQKQLPPSYILRETAKVCKETLYIDAIEILNNLKIQHIPHKTSGIIEIQKNSFNFTGADKYEKYKGVKSGYVLMDEANNYNRDFYDQFLMRNQIFIALTLNPSEAQSWVYQLAKNTKDVHYHTTTYKDNPYISKAELRTILSWENTAINRERGTTNEYLWSVYALGLPTKKPASILNAPNIIKEGNKLGDLIGFGLDFGFAAPNGIVAMYIKKNRPIFDEINYQSKLGFEDYIRIFKHANPDNLPIIADSEDPYRIAQLAQARLNIHPARKGAGGIKEGFRLLNELQYSVTEHSINIIKETRELVWKKDNLTGIMFDKPSEKCQDHLIDAMRYILTEYVIKRA